MLFMSDSTILKLDMSGKNDSDIVNNSVFLQVDGMFYEYIRGTNIKLMKRNKCHWETKGMVVGYSGNFKLSRRKFMNSLVVD